MEYSDSILSHFRDKSALDVSKLSELVNAQKVEYGGGNKGPGVYSAEKAVKYCEEALSLYTDLIKLKLILRKTWDVQTLDKAAMVRFGIQKVEGSVGSGKDIINTTEEFYRDIALQTVARSDKISKALEQLTKESDKILGFLQSITKGHIEDYYMQDPVCLLLEMWLLCCNMLRELKMNVASFFIKAKLLLIDYELENIQLSITGNESKKEQYQALSEIITSYNSFIKALIQQLQDSETTSDKALFEECLGIFLDVEAMYHSLNMTWLLAEDTPLLGQMGEQELEEMELREWNNVGAVSQFVNNAVNDYIPFDSDEHSMSSGPDLSVETVVSDPGVKKGSKKNKLDSPVHIARHEDPLDLDDVNMEHTSITKELPKLLKAFKNAKLLEMELENVRLSPELNAPLSVSASPSPGQSASSNRSPKLQQSQLFSAPGVSTSPNQLLQTHIPLPQTASLQPGSLLLFGNRHPMPDLSATSVFGNLVNKAQDCNAPDTLAMKTNVRNDLSKLMKTNSMLRNFNHQNRVHGFGSTVLNNLYGIGSSK